MARCREGTSRRVPYGGTAKWRGDRAVRATQVPRHRQDRDRRKVSLNRTEAAVLARLTARRVTIF